MKTNRCLKPHQTTPFQERVFRVIRTIPRGHVVTYKMVAEAIGCGSAQAIGQALKRNPDAPATPCHRVVSSDLRPGGYQGSTETETIAVKTGYLKEEGITLADGKVPRKYLYYGLRRT